MGERSITQAKASVMLYDNERKQWQHSGGNPGLSRVNIYFHPVNNTFRIVGRKLDDHAVVINCALARGLKYNEATPTFHQWRDQRQVYGLNFQSGEDANKFGQEVRKALETLKEATVVAPQPAQSFQQRDQQRDQFFQEPVSNGPQHDDMPPQMRQQQRYADYDSQDNYSSRPRVPTAGAQDRQQYRQYESQISGGGSESESPSSSQLSVVSSLPPASPIQSSAPPAPTPPPAPPAPPAAPPVPAAPPAPPVPSAPAPPQPPPAPAIGGPPPPPPPPPAPSSGGGGGGSLADQIAAAKLKKASASKSDSDGGGMRLERAGSTARSNNAGGVGGMDMMAEMQKKLAARRAKTDDKPVSNGPVREEERSFPSVRSTTNTPSSPTPTAFSSSKTNFGNPPPSQPKTSRSESRFTSSGSISKSDVSKSDVTLTSDQLEEFKTELLTAFRQELENYKEEIIEAVRQEVSKMV